MKNISSSEEDLGYKIPLICKQTTVPLLMQKGRKRNKSRSKFYQARKRKFPTCSNSSAKNICRYFLSKRAQMKDKIIQLEAATTDQKEEEEVKSSEYLYSLDPTSPLLFKIMERLNKSGELSLKQVPGYGQGILVERGVMLFDEFIKLGLGYLMRSETPYYLPLLDNDWRFVGEFAEVDDLSLPDLV